jgi:hypothetical protein
MNNPDWYDDWRHDALHQLQEKNAQLREEFKLGQWPRFDYDIDAGTLIFSEKGHKKVIAEIQIVGTTSVKAGNWLWAWANSSFPADRIVDAQRTCDFGEEHGIDELINDYVEDEDLSALGWELTGVAASVCESLGAYRPPREEGGGLFLLYRSIRWAM